MPNEQCDYCGRILPDQDTDGTRSPSENVFCSIGCCQAHELHAALQSEGISGCEDDAEAPALGPDAFDMVQLAAA